MVEITVLGGRDISFSSSPERQADEDRYIPQGDRHPTWKY